MKALQIFIMLLVVLYYKRTPKPLSFLLFLAFILAMSSCNPVRRITRIAANHPAAAATVCGKLYPPKEYTVTNTQYKEGKTVYRYDTVSVDCDTVILNQDRPHKRTVRLPCPPCPVRVDTVITETVRQVENTARITALTADREKYLLRSERLEKGRNTWRAIAVFLLLAVIVRLMAKLWLKI